MSIERSRLYALSVFRSTLSKVFRATLNLPRRFRLTSLFCVYLVKARSYCRISSKEPQDGLSNMVCMFFRKKIFSF